MKKLIVPAALALSIAALAGCDRPATTTSTTVVKEPAKETVVQRDVPTSSTTLVNPSTPAPSSSTNVTVDATKPSTSESSSSTSTTRVDTPAGSATKTERTKTETTK